MSIEVPDEALPACISVTTTDTFGNLKFPHAMQLVLQLVTDGVVLTQTHLPHNFHAVQAVQAHVLAKPDRYEAGRLVPVTLVPWAAVEEIAKYVEGDGTDAQRLALADGIRNRKWP